MKKKRIVAKVECKACGKPFHVDLNVVYKKRGEEEDIALDWPYFQKTVIVRLPRGWVEKDWMFRNMKSHID